MEKKFVWILFKILKIGVKREIWKLIWYGRLCSYVFKYYLLILRNVLDEIGEGFS